MKTTYWVFAVSLLIGGSVLSGCSADGELELTPEQQAELDESRADLKKRGWIDVKPIPSPYQTEDQLGEEASDDAVEDPFEGSGLPASEMPPID